MPSPRAVLADVKNFRLDPRKAYSTTHANGHLAKAVNKSSVEAVDVSSNEVFWVQEEVETHVEQAAVTKVVEEPVQVLEPDNAPVEEQLAVEEVVDDASVDVEQHVSQQEPVTGITKKQKKAKKVS